MPVRILVIEDNPSSLELMSYLLKAFGYAVLTATDGGEGLEVVRRTAPDLVLCDVQLPTVDGYEVARQIKGEALLRAIPLLAVTALAMVGDRDKALAAGFDGYLPKPINPETFVKQVEAYLLPAQRNSAPPGNGQKTSAPAKSKTHHTLLVVDNLPVNLDLARSVLEPFGYRVVTADGMGQALDMVRRIPCDLILSDVCMLQGTGYDFIRAVKADPRLRSIPFVFITSTMMDEKDRVRGLALGAARFLFRPIEPEALLAEINACLLRK